jgi:hypothetical protein
MASRLFRAIVGVGISLAGAAGAAACAETTLKPLDSDEDAAPTAADAAKKPDGTSDNPDVTVVPDDDANVAEDGSTDDDAVAVVDASADVIADAFCDAPWPTTKTNVGPRCYPKVADHICGPTNGTPATCGGDVWACAADELYMMDCWCFAAAAPDASTCTDAGFVPLDAATDGG